MKLKKSIKSFINRFPGFNNIARFFVHRNPFPGSSQYWERRYAGGGNSGDGSYGKFVRFKADFLNEFVKKNEINSVIDFGCGDGNLLSFSQFPAYVGLDVSQTAIDICREKFKHDNNKIFKIYDPSEDSSTLAKDKSDLAISLDVIYHLIEDNIFHKYMLDLFSSTTKYVIIYSSDTDEQTGCKAPHVRHRNFKNWIKQNLPDWKLKECVENPYPFKDDYSGGSFSDFFIFEKISC